MSGTRLTLCDKGGFLRRSACSKFIWYIPEIQLHALRIYDLMVVITGGSATRSLVLLFEEIYFFGIFTCILEQITLAILAARDSTVKNPRIF
jgi:hypothetical protein